MCIRIIAKQLRLTVAQLCHLGNYLIIIALIAIIATLKIGLIDLLTQRSVLRIGQKRQHAGFLQREDILITLAHRLGLLASSITYRCGESIQIRQIHLKRKCIGLGKYILTKLYTQCRQLFVDLLKRGLILCREQCSRANEILIHLLRKAQLITRQALRRTAIIDLLHSLKQSLIHSYGIIVRSQTRKDLRSIGLHLIVGLG